MTAKCRWTHPPAGCCPPPTESGDHLTARRTDRSPYQQAGLSQCCHGHRSDIVSVKSCQTDRYSPVHEQIMSASPSRFFPSNRSRFKYTNSQQLQGTFGVKFGRRHFLICSKFWVAMETGVAIQQQVEPYERVKVEERD